MTDVRGSSQHALEAKRSEQAGPYVVTTKLPEHLKDWRLPPGWGWGAEGLALPHRHYQEIIDALGRSLSLVSAPDPAHSGWLEAEARHLAHRNHPAIPTTYHYWGSFAQSHRGPGYLRRWIAGETIGGRIRRMGPDDISGMVRLLRDVGSALTYLHDLGQPFGCLSPDTIWTVPMGRLWRISWHWAIPLAEIPRELRPDRQFMPTAPEWVAGDWAPSHASDQWQLGALCFYALTGEAQSSSHFRRPANPSSSARLSTVCRGGHRPCAQCRALRPISVHRDDGARGGPARREPGNSPPGRRRHGRASRGGIRRSASPLDSW